MIIQERLKEIQEKAACTSPHLGYSNVLDALEVAVQALETILKVNFSVVATQEADKALDQITKLLEGK